MTSLRNRISLFSIFAFGILIGLVSTVFLVKAHKKQEIPAAFYVATEKIKVVTNISDEFSRRSILGHRDEQLTYTNIPRPLFDSCNKQSVETYRFSYRDAWLRSSFTLSLSARGESANAVWQ